MTDLEQLYRNRGFARIAGVDEAGRGPLAGPVVAAAVILPAGQWIEDVDDSKKLTAAKREELFDAVQREAVSVGIGIVDHRVIDEINILQATIQAMRKAVDTLTVKPDLILADGNCFSHENLPFENIIDGDALCYSIAAASIIAKVTRDRLMLELDTQYPLYGFARHKGYATKEHLEALKNFGMCEIHRKSFKPAALREPEPDLFGDLL